ncbi:hypothetical protein [Paenibacillus sp. GXUN7292]|uniref:hypothetical protein n=1 Tax=Paenibacillus sp. GXUN7292 TaxID=3422499 RepID=UPI003D7C8C81
MNLQYKGQNARGRIVWIDADYYDQSRPHEGFEMEEWQTPSYRELVETAERCIGRKLTKEEARTMNWLSSGDKSTCSNITRFIKEAFEKGQVEKQSSIDSDVDSDDDFNETEHLSRKFERFKKMAEGLKASKDV